MTLLREEASKGRESTNRFQGLNWSPEPKSLNLVYSSRVGRLKKIFLVGAVVLGSLILLWPNVHLVEDPFLNDPSSLSHAASGPALGMKYMAQANLHAITQKGQPYTVHSQSATQVSSDQFVFEKPEATVFLKGGGTFTVNSLTGEGSKKEKLLNLTENVKLQQSGGYEIETRKATLDLNEGDAHGNEPVVGSGPLGIIQAGGFHTQNQGEVVVFRDGVHLSFIPPLEEKKK
jgi:lipopolysaccharide export system protein LptC